MREKRYFLFFVIFLLLLRTSSLYAQEHKIIIKTIEESGAPIPKVSVSIDGSKYYKTNDAGTAEFTPAKKLEMPFKVLAEKANYKIHQFLYLEESHEIEISLSKVDLPAKKDSLVVSFTNSDKTKIETAYINIDGKLYNLDKYGKIFYKGTITDKTKIAIPGSTITSYEFNKRKNSLTITGKKNSNEPVVVNPLTDSTALAPVFDEKPQAFKQYKEDFGKIADEIIQEKVRLEKKNLEINQEIEQIKSRLANDTTLSGDERKELERYLEHLGSLLMENNIAFHKAEEKTKLLIQKLRMIILSKDSINYQAKLQIEKEKKERELTEKRFERNILIFSVATATLLLLAIVFYFVAVRIKKQKKELEKANINLKEIKDELIRNVEEVKSQKDLIEEQNSQLDAFVYKASHDIKGPLRSIIGLTQTGLKVVKDAESLEFFDHILKSTLKLDNLLADLLKVAKANQAEVQKTKINVSKIVDECLLSFKNVSEYSNMRFAIDIDKNMEFYTDEKAFYSIVQNFIENGIKYKDDKKKPCFLNISAKFKDQKLIMEFTDNGLGIDQAHQAKIFEMFYKVDPSSIGTGLGLHIVKLNIKKLNGNIHVESQFGKGSTFTVTLNN